MLVRRPSIQPKASVGAQVNIRGNIERLFRKEQYLRIWVLKTQNSAVLRCLEVKDQTPGLGTGSRPRIRCHLDVAVWDSEFQSFSCG